MLRAAPRAAAGRRPGEQRRPGGRADRRRRRPGRRAAARVAAVTAADFVVDDHDLPGCLDLVLTRRTPVSEPVGTLCIVLHTPPAVAAAPRQLAGRRGVAAPGLVGSLPAAADVLHRLAERGAAGPAHPGRHPGAGGGAGRPVLRCASTTAGWAAGSCGPRSSPATATRTCGDGEPGVPGREPGARACSRPAGVHGGSAVLRPLRGRRRRRAARRPGDAPDPAAAAGGGRLVRAARPGWTTPRCGSAAGRPGSGCRSAPGRRSWRRCSRGAGVRHFLVDEPTVRAGGRQHRPAVAGGRQRPRGGGPRPGAHRPGLVVPVRLPARGGLPRLLRRATPAGCGPRG